MMGRIYEPFDPSKEQIRLLLLGPLDDGGRIAVHLRTVDLSDDIGFIALSYVWGDATVTEDILLNGEVKAVTTNLVSALRHVPKHIKIDNLWLWADAICIDQNNVSERNGQVKLMGRIFAKATLVFSWLGADDPRTDLALETFALIAKEAKNRSKDDFCSLQWMEAHPDLCKDDHTDTTFPRNYRWFAVLQFLVLSYFSRVWVLQEMAFASNLVLSSCNQVVAFEALYLVVARLAATKELIREGLVLCPNFLKLQSTWSLLQSDSIDLAEIKRINACRHWGKKILGNGFIGEEDFGWRVSLIGLTLQATDPKDHVYALLALTNLDVDVDYSEAKSVSSVYCDYVAEMIRFFSKEERHLSTLQPLVFLQWAGVERVANDIGFPSWVPNFPEISKIRGWQSSPRDDYRADRGVFFDDPQPAAVDQVSLSVSGVFIDAAAKIGPVLDLQLPPDGSLLRYCIGFVARSLFSEMEVPPFTAILRTLKMDSSHEMDDVNKLYILQFIDKYLLSADPANASDHLKALGFGDLDVTTLRSLPNLYYVRSNKNRGDDFPPQRLGDRDELLTLIHDLASLENHWRFFETISGYMGLAPPNTQLGDMVFVLKGSGAPVVLRKETDHYVHVGTCFIWNLMNGEARTLIESGERTVERVVMR